MARRRKPISFNTTLRNPERLPQFISILANYEGEIVSEEIAFNIEADFIRSKIFEPTKSTLGTYVKEYHDKFDFIAEDQNEDFAQRKVNEIFDKWVNNDKYFVSREEIVYLLKNTITKHKERGWAGGWQSRFETQVEFINELGFARVEKNKILELSETGKYMIRNYTNGYQNDEYNDIYEVSAYLNSFAKYQINNPYRMNTIDVNFFPLVLKTIKYLNSKYQSSGLFCQDLPFIICWGNNDYERLGDLIHQFREEYGYNTSNEMVYDFAMNFLDDTQPTITLRRASQEFINRKNKDYKFDKITGDTPDEIIRKLRLTMLVSLRGNGRFIDINNNEIKKIQYIIENYSNSQSYEDDDESKIRYLSYMGTIDNNLLFSEELETEEENDIKTQTINDWANDKTWEYLMNELIHISDNTESSDSVLRMINSPVRLEFLSAIVLKKALPNITIKANYRADDQGIPFNVACGRRNNSNGADIDVYCETVHVLAEPTVSKQRSFQVEHELPAIRNHVFGAKELDTNNNYSFNEWFAIFIAPNISRDVGDQVALIKALNNVEIYPWEIIDFVSFSMNATSINDYKTYRPYAIPQRL